MAEEKLYYKYLRSEKNERDSYSFRPPIFGESNTDQSYYEPQSSRIANMRKSASGLSSGAYDFEAGEINKKNWSDKIGNLSVPIGRKPGITFEEISQIQTINEHNIVTQSKDAEQASKDSQEISKQNIKQAVAMSKAISESSSPKVE